MDSPTTNISPEIPENQNHEEPDCYFIAIDSSLTKQGPFTLLQIQNKYLGQNIPRDSKILFNENWMNIESFLKSNKNLLYKAATTKQDIEQRISPDEKRKTRRKGFIKIGLGILLSAYVLLIIPGAIKGVPMSGSLLLVASAMAIGLIIIGLIDVISPKRIKS